MDRKPTIRGQPAEAPKAVPEDFTPLFEWTQDLSNHILHIHLPGFKRDNIRVLLDDSGKLQVKGSRIESKNINLDQSFEVPKNTILKEISARFEDGVLSLFMPKRDVEELQVTQKIVSKDRFQEYGAKYGILQKLNRNRKVVAVAIAAVSVGLFVSYKVRASGK